MNNCLSILIKKKKKNDILEIINFIANDNSKAALGVLNILEEIFKMLAEFPAAGVRKIGIKDDSVLVYTAKKRYSIIYRVKNNSLEILRVLTRYQDLFAVL